GWLYCELCRKKTCISFDIMSNHLQSEKHQRYLRWMQMQPEEARMKAIEDMQLTNSPSKEELSAAVVPTAQGGGVGSGAEPPVIKQEDLPKFIELRPDCFYCTLCDARPQAWSSLESHVAGQRHRSRYERAEWEQSGQAAGWYGQLAASSASAASTTVGSGTPLDHIDFRVFLVSMAARSAMAAAAVGCRTAPLRSQRPSPATGMKFAL
ncbi:hypothetical protein FOZ63_016134, partial [Perkinsus olseni]